MIHARKDNADGRMLDQIDVPQRRRREQVLHADIHNKLMLEAQNRACKSDIDSVSSCYCFGIPAAVQGTRRIR